MSAATATETKRCHQCGRTGTREFVPYPDFEFDYTYEGRTVLIQVGQWGWECANKTACRKRWPKRRMEDED